MRSNFSVSTFLLRWLSTIVLVGVTGWTALAQQPCRGSYQTPHPISKPEPDYPVQAWSNGIEGTVWLTAVIDERGIPQHITVDRGIKELNANAIVAVEKWVFEPATCNGKPVQQVAKIDIHFQVQHAKPKPVTAEIEPAVPLSEPPVPTQPQPPSAPASCTNFQPPRVTLRVEPKYTEQARRDGIEGDVSVYLVVNDVGAPTRVRILQGLEPGLDQNAIDAVRQWQFRPGTCDGKPVAREAQVAVHFALGKEQPTPWRPTPPKTQQLPNGRPSLLEAEGQQPPSEQ